MQSEKHKVMTTQDFEKHMDDTEKYLAYLDLVARAYTRQQHKSNAEFITNNLNSLNKSGAKI